MVMIYNSKSVHYISKSVSLCWEPIFIASYYKQLSADIMYNYKVETCFSATRYQAQATETGFNLMIKHFSCP